MKTLPRFCAGTAPLALRQRRARASDTVWKASVIAIAETLLTDFGKGSIRNKKETTQ